MHSKAACNTRPTTMRPLACDGVDTWGSYSLTLIDFRDKLAVIGNYRRILDTVIEKYKTEMESESGWIYNGPLIRMAEDIARRLLPTFNTTTGLPQVIVTCTAGVGTMIVEFGAHSRINGASIYEEVFQNAIQSFQRHKSAIGKWHMRTHICRMDCFRVTRNNKYMVNNGERMVVRNEGPDHLIAELPPLRRKRLTEAERQTRRLQLEAKRLRIAAKARKAIKQVDIEGWQMVVPRTLYETVKTEPQDNGGQSTMVSGGMPANEFDSISSEEQLWSSNPAENNDTAVAGPSNGSHMSPVSELSSIALDLSSNTQKMLEDVLEMATPTRDE